MNNDGFASSNWSAFEWQRRLETLETAVDDGSGSGSGSSSANEVDDDSSW